MWLCKPIYVPTTWVIHIQTHACKHTHTHVQDPAHAGGLPGFFHQLDLSQLIISSFEPWAQSMIALSINACMIYFDGASNDKCLACVCVYDSVCMCVCVCLGAHVQACASLHIYMSFCRCGSLYIHSWPCPCVCLSITVGTCVHVCEKCACVRACVCVYVQGLVRG